MVELDGGAQQPCRSLGIGRSPGLAQGEQARVAEDDRPAGRPEKSLKRMAVDARVPRELRGLLGQVLGIQRERQIKVKGSADAHLGL